MNVWKMRHENEAVEGEEWTTKSHHGVTQAVSLWSYLLKLSLKHFKLKIDPHRPHPWLFEKNKHYTRPGPAF